VEPATAHAAAITSQDGFAAASSASSIGIFPTTIVGGDVAMGEVFLSAPAPVGGALVNLSSNSPFASVPKTVWVYERWSSLTFKIKTKQVTSPRTVTISATYGVTVSTSLTIVAKATALSSVRVNPTTVVGGSTAQGTANLTGPAPTGGLTVSLASDNQSVAGVPPSVTVPSGSSSANFNVTTSTVVNETSAMISGAYSGATSGSSLTVQPPSSGAQFYVSPTGSASGNGSFSNPWNLRTALNQPASVQPGATINLRGGTYVGKFVSNLTSTASNPITVRSYPGEWAKIEGYLTSTLRVALPSSAGDPVTVVFNTDPSFPSGVAVRIGNEYVFLAGKQSDGVTWTNCARGWSGTTPVAHSVGSLALASGDQLAINGQYTFYRDFEIFNSKPERSFNAVIIPQDERGEGITVNPSTGIKLINLVIHDNREGIFAGIGALGLEIYGCIIFNNGLVDWQRGHGLGIYVLNGPGAPQKRIRNVFSFNGFVDGMKAYSESQYAQNFLFEHVISFNNGVLAGFPGNQGDNGSPLAPNHRACNIFAGTGNSNNPINDILIHDCYLFHPFDAKPQGGNLALGYQAPGATGLEITNSRIMGGNNALGLSHFRTFTVTGNKLYAQATSPGNVWNTLVSAQLESGYSGTWNNNTYFEQLPIAWQFLFTNGTAIRHACDTGAILKSTETGCSPNGGWKEHTGFDANSSFSHGAPTGTEVFVMPNEYEAGRAHIAIYNWALNSSVNVNLSNVLVVGDQYAVYAVEDYFGSPVQMGIYDGNPVAVPMTGTSVSAPIGLGWTPQTVRPQFGAFVVKRQ